MSRCAAGMDDLRRYLEKSDIQVIMILEPYARHNISWPGCSIFHGAGAGEDIWTITVVRDLKLSAVLCESLSSSECTVVEIRRLRAGHALVMINGYFRYNENIEPHIKNLEDTILAFPGKSLVVSAAVNARSTLSYNDITDERGAKLENCILTYDLDINNRSSELTTFENTRGHRNDIGITLNTARRDVKIRDWEVCVEPFLTDHRLVTYKIEFVDDSGSSPRDQPPSGESPKWNLRDINWKTFDALLLTDLGEAVNFDEKNLDGKVRILTELLQPAECEAVKIRRTNRITPRWWNQQLDHLRAAKVYTERKWQKAKKR